MTTRILPREEWPRLVGTEAETVWPQLSDAARVVVVEEDGEIIGCHLLQPVLHAECLWTHPDHRGSVSVLARLWSTVKRIAREEFGVSHVATSACSDDVRRLLARAKAVKVEADSYMVPVGER